MPAGNDFDQSRNRGPDSLILGWREGLEHCRSLHHLGIGSNVDLFELPIREVNALDAYRTAQEREWIESWGLDNLSTAVISHGHRVSCWQHKDGLWSHYQPVHLVSGHIAEVLRV